ncbi:MAG: hypothetical protein ACFCUQ_01475 [Kiloniellales bacterium]
MKITAQSRQLRGLALSVAFGALMALAAAADAGSSKVTMAGQSHDSTPLAVSSKQVEGLARIAGENARPLQVIGPALN